jgi:aconitate hydratase
MARNPFNTEQQFQYGAGKSGQFHSLPALEKAAGGSVSRLPISLRIVLESALRNYDGRKITEAHIRELVSWSPKAARTSEVPFVVARVLLQDMTGVPLVVDFAAMREAAKKMGKNPEIIEPLCPGHLVIDHSVQVDTAGTPDALKKNMEIEFMRNRERYQFLKWSAQAFKTFHIVPPGNGICHQVNLEYVSQVVWQKDGVFYPDTLVGIDSHTTMVNGLGVLAGSVLIAVAAIAVQHTSEFAGIQPRGLTIGEVAMLAGYATLMLGVCALACVVPTLRVLRVQPTEALRAE